MGFCSMSEGGVVGSEVGCGVRKGMNHEANRSGFNEQGLEDWGAI